MLIVHSSRKKRTTTSCAPAPSSWFVVRVLLVAGCGAGGRVGLRGFRRRLGGDAGGCLLRRSGDRLLRRGSRSDGLRPDVGPDRDEGVPCPGGAALPPLRALRRLRLLRRGGRRRGDGSGGFPRPGRALDRAEDALGDRVGVIELRLAAGGADPDGDRADEALPRDAARAPLQLVERGRLERRDPDEDPAGGAQPDVRADDVGQPAIDGHPARFDSADAQA